MFSSECVMMACITECEAVGKQVLHGIMYSIQYIQRFAQFCPSGSCCILSEEAGGKGLVDAEKMGKKCTQCMMSAAQSF